MPATKLQFINVAHHRPKNTWQMTLHSSDGTVWTIEYGDKKRMMDRAEEFAEFAGLPAYLHGSPLTADAEPLTDEGELEDE